MSKKTKNSASTLKNTTERKPEMTVLQEDVSVNDFIDRLPQNMQREATAIFMAMEQKSFQGPIPSPEDLQGYEDVLPNAANRIISMAENNSAHRREMEKAIIEGNLNLSKRGQWMGFVLAILFVGIAVYLSLNDHETTGVVLLTTTMIGVLVVFVLNKQPWKNQND